MKTPGSTELAGIKARFEEDGYLALEGYFSPSRVDRVNAEMERLLRERGSEIVVDSCFSARRAFWAQIGAAETRHFKFNDLYLLSPIVREMALDSALSAPMEALLADAPVLCNSLNFEKGSTQPKHIDSLYMTPQTPHALIASWIALEDAHPDSGPLSYFPGSHKIPLFRFKDGSHHATPGEQNAWNDYIQKEIADRRLPEQVFLAKKGDVFLWHADLVHGGTPIRDENRTRKSLVCHYYTAQDSMKMGAHLIPLHRGLWLDRLRHPIRLPPADFGAKLPFPEETYLARYPDVKAAVAAKTCPSGRFHYEQFGYAEGRGV